MGESYKDAGVDITAGEEAVEAIKADVRSTYRPEVIGDIGGFGGLFAFPQLSRALFGACLGWRLHISEDADYRQLPSRSCWASPAWY